MFLILKNFIRLISLVLFCTTFDHPRQKQSFDRVPPTAVAVRGTDTYQCYSTMATEHMVANKGIKMKEGQIASRGITVNESGKGYQSHKQKDTIQQERGNSSGEVCGETREKYSKELTVEVEVVGAANISMMDLLRGVKKECGEVVGCRVKGEKTYELTMRDETTKKKLMDGVRVKGAMVQSRDIVNNEMVVSFINLPVYLEDGKILAKLEEWGVKPLSAIKRRVWPGTDIVDGTRFLKVRFTDEVRSLPYSTKFDTLRGIEYFRVIHDRQVRVCRMCIKPGHLFRECPEFKCFTCGKVGHYARECGERRERELEQEEKQQDQDKSIQDDQSELRNVESMDEEDVIIDKREINDGGDKIKWGWRVETTSDEADDDEERMKEDANEEYREEVEDGKEATTSREKKVQQDAALQDNDSKSGKDGTSSQSVQTRTQKLSAKRKAERDKGRIEQIKELRSGM